MTTALRIDPVTRFVRELEGDYYLPREAAVVLGITVDRLKRLGRQYPDTLGPGYVTWWGDVKLFLYDDADIVQIRSYFEKLDEQCPPELSRYRNRNGRGRPPVWSHDEHASRHRRRALCRYHRRAADRFAEQGRHDRAQQARERAEQINAELAAERAVRDEQLHPAR